MALSVGSIWRKWDLHIHTPASGLNNQFPHTPDGEPDWEAYVAKLESLQDISVIALTDYFTIEGYRKVREFRAKNRLQNVSLILPNIEFRLDKIVGSAKGARRLNYHVIFSDDVSPEEIEEHFLQELKFCFEGDPQRSDLSWTIRRTNLELLGRKLKQEHAPFADRSDFEIGCMNATVDPGKIKEVLDSKAKLFKGKYLIALAEENTALMDWNGQDHLTRKVLLQGADVILSPNRKTALWARGESALTPAQFRAEFKTLKPCLHGSDAHDLEGLGKPAENRYCWIKSDPTFEGLKQVLYEPRDRVFIGDSPPNLKHDYQVIRSVTIEHAAGWFDPAEIPLNQDMVAVIGPRGSGKSALAEAIAFAGGAELFRDPDDIHDTFLYKASQKSTANPIPITGASVTLRWRDGKPDSVTIPATLSHGREDEKVKYLPQKFVERLCAPENNRQLEQEIERVIFQRIAKTERLEASNFQELRQASTRPVELKRSKLVRSIQGLNQSIADAQARIALRPTKEGDLKRKRDELNALLKNIPQVPQENQEEVHQLEELTKQKQDLELQVVRLSEQLSTLDTIGTKVDGLKEDLAAFNEEIKELLGKVELEDEAVRLEVHVPVEWPVVIAKRRANVTAAIERVKQGDPNEKSLPHLAEVNKRIGDGRSKSKLTESKRKQYEKFQKDRQVLEESIAALEREIRELDEVIAPRAREDSDARIERYLDCLALLKEERTVLERLYEPLHGALLASNEIARKLTFVSRVTFDSARQAKRGMELLDRRKSAYREEEELDRALKRFFHESEDGRFERTNTKSALIALRDSFLSVNGKPVAIVGQLRKDRTSKEFADWFYGVDAFAVTYSIKFDGKDLQLLSPGEKGIVLLLLYLEAEDEDNRPLIVDQPDDNLDNVSVYPNLIEYFRARKRSRQVIIITHNPNLVVNTDAEQVFVAGFDGSRSPKIAYRSGSLENSNPSGPIEGIREEVCKILEGGTVAFRLREQRYALP